MGLWVPDFHWTQVGQVGLVVPVGLGRRVGRLCLVVRCLQASLVVLLLLVCLGLRECWECSELVGRVLLGFHRVLDLRVCHLLQGCLGCQAVLDCRVCLGCLVFLSFREVRRVLLGLEVRVGKGCTVEYRLRGTQSVVCPAGRVFQVGLVFLVLRSFLALQTGLADQGCSILRKKLRRLGAWNGPPLFC